MSSSPIRDWQQSQPGLQIHILYFRHFRVLLLLALTLVFASACSPPQKPVKVDHLPKELLDAIKNNDLNKAMQYYSAEFFKSRPKSQWQQRLSSLLQQYGPVTAVSFRNKQADTRFSGKFYIYQYDTVHGKKRIKHIITYVHSVDSGNLELVGHKITE